jgi:long-chain acyl-CoA synthetase
LLGNTYDILAAIGANSSRFLSILPLYHTNGQVYNILVPILSGSTIYCLPEYNLGALSYFWSAIEAHTIEFVDLVPTVISLLLKLPPHRRVDASSIKFVICGAAPISEKTIAAFEDTFGVAVLQEYGLSEATCTSAMETPDARFRGSVGRPLPGNCIQIRNDEGRSLEPGERGEICIFGSYNMVGYIGGGENYGLTLEDGWLHTGDLGYIDADGFLFICGRKKDVIIKGGETIIPEDVEKLALLLPDVHDAATLAIPDEIFGEVIYLFIVPTTASKGPDAFLRECRKIIPRAWWPSRIILTDQIPRTPSGKIRRNQLTQFIPGGLQ